ncbi:MAG: toxin co-regulated pilus biosynthesis Q family protein [Alphaproteobacteria bacterium]|nr:toxin co-regulated pilus biosynthesis Q family protein [Alphaproteobacteria bacterium]MDA7982792.1 toxin co-regulated pilus biosynthesis Q family protein [Alphaproteobacteria bacterium]MDA7984210.1 toxin co-regulated pilus biosynthesis Q family protein [Alphaproteobacteria bacterium]MDA7987089.1 toxin co-regulated pilus biosynthesis Q family protein [Alphaproteobacteria bacterium]MDA7988318.1 toxin co-regulated pilus biosynthesis Q family protein [Alphaproteobacteria bacterium]
MRVLRKTLPGTGASARAESREGEEAGRERGRAKTRSRVLGALAAAACAGLLLSAFNATETQAQETWIVGPGKSLRAHLEEWTSRAGWTLVWEEEAYDIDLSSGVALTGSFEQAIVTLIEGIPSANAVLYRGNKTLVVTVKGSAEQ